jgi:son of sevenless-like protein
MGRLRFESKKTLYPLSTSTTIAMNGISGTVAPPGGMYVRALYDYDADDRTSLSFRQGDIIQVITQLESGWWDGVINGVRGWFPSNYCAVVPRPSDDFEDDRHGGHVEEEPETHSLGGSDYTGSDTESLGDSTSLPIERHGVREQEEAAFWIPQATPDGRLFYFNTLTGVSTMELPLETPGPNENGPRDRTNVFIPESSRPPAEMLASGYPPYMEDTDDENSASDFEGPGMGGSHSSLVSSENQSRIQCTNSSRSLVEGAYPTVYHPRRLWTL